MLFAIIPFRGHNNIDKALRDLNADYMFHQEESGCVFLVDSRSTTKELKDHIGLNGTLDASGIILPINNYSGFTNPNIWEWIRNHEPSI